MSKLVIDASMALAWWFADEGGELVTKARRQAVTFGAAVPAIWAFEVANGLIMAERRKRATAQRTFEAVELLSELAIETDLYAGIVSLQATIELAREHGLTVYDAAYLELALRLQSPLATLDRSLQNAARTHQLLFE